VLGRLLASCGNGNRLPNRVLLGFVASHYVGQAPRLSHAFGRRLRRMRDVGMARNQHDRRAELEKGCSAVGVLGHPRALGVRQRRRWCGRKLAGWCRRRDGRLSRGGGNAAGNAAGGSDTGKAGSGAGAERWWCSQWRQRARTVALTRVA
jgi:hypothetical protein